MYYQNRDELPVTIRDVLPPEAQDAYVDAYNTAWELYEDSGGQQSLSQESMAHQVAWDAVNREFVKVPDTGQWHRVGEEPEQEEEQKGFFEKLRGMF